MELFLQVFALAYLSLGTWLACDTMDEAAVLDPRLSFFESFIVQYLTVLLIVLSWGVILVWLIFKKHD